MVLYVILEGVLAKTLSGQDIPRKISDLKLDWSAIEWISQRDWTDIVVLSNQTWIYGSKGIRCGERFRSKIEYVTECLREELEVLGKTPRFRYKFSMRYPWCSGITDVDLLDEIWAELPGIKSEDCVFMCRPIEFDVNYAKSKGITKILTRWWT